MKIVSFKKFIVNSLKKKWILECETRVEQASLWMICDKFSIQTLYSDLKFFQTKPFQFLNQTKSTLFDFGLV